MTTDEIMALARECGANPDYYEIWSELRAAVEQLVREVTVAHLVVEEARRNEVRAERKLEQYRLESIEMDEVAVDRISRAERERNEATAKMQREKLDIVERAERAERERDELRALLATARDHVLAAGDYELAAAIDAALEEGK